VFEATDAAGPYTFAAADMTKVVSNVNAINSSLSIDYWDNFKPTNNTSPEILFLVKYTRWCRWRYPTPLENGHALQTPDGWNGFAIVSEFYNNYNLMTDV
jgi:hypothetical protein